LYQNNIGEMLCAGILPINQMRDYVSPASVMSSRIPQHLLEAAYGMHIVRELDFKDNPDRPPNGHEMLIAYCAVKGYITNGTGRWDEFRACKEMLRDFNDGRILFVAPPFVENPEDAESVAAADNWRKETEHIMMKSARVAQRLAAQAHDAAHKPQQTHQHDPMAAGASAGVALGYTSGAMVFGDGNWAVGDDDADDNDEDGDLEMGEDSTAGGDAEKREHKRLKHWGKKNRKLRDKDPYGDKNGTVSYAVYSTNRARTGVVKTEDEQTKRRQDPRATYGTEYKRPQHPHQMNNVTNLTGKLTSSIVNTKTTTNNSSSSSSSSSANV
jgi:hypothetical protein